MKNSRMSIAWMLLAVAACRDPGADKAAISKAFEGSLDRPEQLKKADEGLKKLREKADADAKAAYAAAFELATTAPTQLPADIKSACNDAGQAMDVFMRNRLVGEELDRWNAVKEADIKRTTDECLKRDNLQVAACQANAFQTAKPNIPDDQAMDLTMRCVAKYGGIPEGAPRAAAVGPR